MLYGILHIIDYKNYYNVSVYCVLADYMALNGINIPGDAYAWIVVFIMPVNSAFNPYIYTLNALRTKQVNR